MQRQYDMGDDNTLQEGPSTDAAEAHHHDDRPSRRAVEGTEDPRRSRADAAACDLRAGDPRLLGDAAPEGAGVMAKTIQQVEHGLYRRLTKPRTWGEELSHTTVAAAHTASPSTN